MTRKINGSDYVGVVHIEAVSENKKTVFSSKSFNGLIKVSPTVYFDKEKTPACFVVGLGGGYVEGEKYKYSIDIKKSASVVLTTQASTKVYKCVHDNATMQETSIHLEEGSILEYVTDSVILYKDAIYKQINEIHMDKGATLIYSDGITSGWSPEGDVFAYKSAQLKTNVYVDGRHVLLDNLYVNPRENDVTKLGYFEKYKNFGTLLVINDKVSHETIESLRNEIIKLNLPIDFGITLLETSGFVLRILSNYTQDIDCAVTVCHNYIRQKLLNLSSLHIRKCN